MTFRISSQTSAPARRSVLRLGVALGAMALAGKLRAQTDSVVRVAAVFTVPLNQPWASRVHEALLRSHQRGEIDYVYKGNVSSEDYEKTLREYAKTGVHLIVGEAFEADAVVYRVARAYPKVAFLVGSIHRPQQPNLAIFDNHIQEPTYLTGMIAGGMSQTGTISLIAGFPVPRTYRLLHAFVDGAREINPDAKFLLAFIQSWFDPRLTRQIAFSHIDQGADVLYAERVGVAEAAQQRGKLVVGSTADLRSLYPDTVIASAVWDTEPTLERALTMVKRGTFQADDYGKYSQMRYQGASLSPLGAFEAKIPAALLARVQARQQTLLDGSFTIKPNETPLAAAF